MLLSSSNRSASVTISWTSPWLKPTKLLLISGSKPPVFGVHILPTSIPPTEALKDEPQLAHKWLLRALETRTVE